MAFREGDMLAARYRAERLLGRGGMGDVWCCLDVEHGGRVAVKVVRRDVLDERMARLFQNEILATARLAHPGIVPVYDIFQDDTTWGLVMEMREGVSLGRLVTKTRHFALVREVLSQLLEALAYAHARGVLHLDIKPDNVIVEQRDGFVRTTLVDFGIARIRRPGEEVDRGDGNIVGTLAYMAPEQVLGDDDRFGPWTDLYALGAMAYHLTSGQRPFAPEALMKKTTHAPPRFTPSLDGVPSTFVDLVMDLVAVKDRDRPTHAADVLSRLRALPTDTTDPVLVLDEALMAHAAYQRSLDSSELTIDRPPEDAWRDKTAPSVVTGVDDVVPPPGAYALFGLRELPVLGRSAEREQTWRAIERTAFERKTNIVVLEGPPGVGKSRIARDMLERGHELGMCHVAMTSWAGRASGEGGLRGLVENILDARGASADRARHLVDIWLERYGKGGESDERFRQNAMLLLHPPPNASPDTRLPIRTAASAIERLAARRSVLLWLDNAHLSRGDAASLLESLRGRSFPVCAIVTVADDDLDSPIEVSRLLEDGGECISLSRLDRDAMQKLVRGLLDVDDQLCELVVDRAEGNPLFATQLLAEMIQENAIRRRDGRYCLSANFDTDSVPQDIARLWDLRVERSGADRASLAALAVTRERVGVEIARELERLRGDTFADALLCAQEGGILRVEGNAYVWVHGLLRAHLMQAVEETAPLHADAAQALAHLVGREDVQEERAQHLWQAGRAREACVTMLEAIEWSQRRAEFAAQRRRCDELLAWTRAGELYDLEARGLAELAFAEAMLGHADEAEGRIAEADGVEALHDLASAWVAIRGGNVARLHGRAGEANARSLRALELAQKSGDVAAEAAARTDLALDAQRKNDLSRAAELLRVAAQQLRVLGDAGGLARALYLLAHTEAEPRLEMVEEAIRIARAGGAQRQEVSARMVYVGFLWKHGRGDDARHEAERAGADARRLGLRQVESLIELQRAYWALVERDFTDAILHRDRAIAVGATTGSTTERCWLAAIRAAIAFRDRNAGEAEDALTTLERERGGYDEEDFRSVLRTALEIAPPAFAPRIAKMLGE